MAQLVKQSCPSNGWSCAYVKSLFESFGSDRISVEISSNNQTATVHIDTAFALEFYMMYGVISGWMEVYPHVNGTRYGRLIMGVAGSNAFITVAIGDNLVFCDVKDHYTRRCMFYCTHIGDNSYYTYDGSGSNQGAGFYNLTNRTLTRLSDNIGFNYKNMLNYIKPTGSIDICNTAYLFQGGQRTDTVDTDLAYSSTITVDTVYTVDGTNYYSLGTNLLLPFGN